MFRVGQKVVCVETWVLPLGCGHGEEIGPVSGNIYTIRDIGVGLNPAFDELQVRLVEINNKVHRYLNGIYEPPFRATRFRPVVERKTDISVFTEILRRESSPVDQVLRVMASNIGEG